MEYEFNEGLHQPEAHCTMGHEAIGFWLTHEVGDNTQRLAIIQQAVRQLAENKAWDFELPGAEYDLLLSRSDAIVKAHSIDQDYDETLEDDLDFYDDESIAKCGLEDFASLIDDWLAFVAG